MLRRRSFRAAGLVVATLTAVTTFAGSASAGTRATITHFPVAKNPARPYSIVTGPDGNLWFTMSDLNAIGRITPSGTVRRFRLPTADSHPYGITVGPDGNLWFTERISNAIGVMDTKGNLLAEYAVPTPNAQPWDIALGSDGALWFTEENVDAIGRVTVDGLVTEGSLDIGTFPTSIAADAKGNLWVTLELGNAIVKLKPVDSFPLTKMQTFPIETPGVLPWDINPGPDGKMWFTTLAGRSIGRVGPRGGIKEFPVPGDQSGIAGITAGPDGNLWITENDSSKVSAITTQGQELESLDTLAYPFGITAGPDGNVWLCEGYGNAVARVDLD
jgi:streptogramin lyase